MVKDKRKIYKCVRKAVDGNKDCLVLKFKNLRPIDIRELRNEINLLTTDFFIQEEPEQPQYDYAPEEKQHEVHFEQSREPKKSCLKIKRHGSQTR